MDTVNQLQQLRLSYAEQDYDTAINRVINWIGTEGQTLLKVNQRMPYNFEEALEARKQHEKMELKCTQFLAFFSQMSLKGFPVEYEEAKRNMDNNIQIFSDQIKAQRHVVVTFYTFYRHLDWIERKGNEYANPNIDDIPNDYEGLSKLVEEYEKKTNELGRKFSHLKVEKDRVFLALDIMLGIEKREQMNYVDKIGVERVKDHLDNLIEQLEKRVTSVYESNRLLEYEFKIELRLLAIEKDMEKSCDWMEKLQEKVEEDYDRELVARGTMENLDLQNKLEELKRRYTQIYDYGKKLGVLYQDLNVKINRADTLGEEVRLKMERRWNEGVKLLEEYETRLMNAYRLFLGLDETLTKLEDILLSLNKEENEEGSVRSFRERFEPMRREMHGDFDELKEIAKEVIGQLKYDLLNNKIQEESMKMEAEQTQATIRMRLFTLAVKLKEFDRTLCTQEPFEFGSLKQFDFKETKKMSSSNRQSRSSSPIGDEGDVDKYIQFLNVSQRNWESKQNPSTPDQSKRLINEHKKLKPQSDEYWQYLVKQKQPNQQKDLEVAESRKQTWDNAWSKHLHQELEPRNDWLLRASDLNGWLDEKIREMDRISERPNSKLEQVQENNEQLNGIDRHVPEKKKELNSLQAESKHVFNGDLDNISEALNEKFNYFEEQLDNSIEIERLIQDIEEFLPQVQNHKSKWNKYKRANKVIPRELEEERSELKNYIDETFDLNKLESLSNICYGSTKKVDWLIEELRLSSVNHDEDGSIVPVRLAKEKSGFVFPEEEVEEELSFIEHEKGELKIEMKTEELVRVQGDQYNLIWYKNDQRIDGDKKSGRVHGGVVPEQKAAVLKIDDVQIEDAGYYHYEIVPTNQQHQSTRRTSESKSVHVNVHQKNGPIPPLDTSIQSQQSIDSNIQSPTHPGFPDIIYAPVDDKLVLNTQIPVYEIKQQQKHPNDSSTPILQLLHNGVPVNSVPVPNMWRQQANQSGTVEFINPAITRKDEGHYQLLFNGKEIADTEIKVGEPPKIIQSHFTKAVHNGEDVFIKIPVANNNTYNNQASQHRQVVWHKDNELLKNDKEQFHIYNDSMNNPCLEVKKFHKALQGIYSCEISNNYGTRHAEVQLTFKRDSISSPTGPVHGTYSRRARGSIDALSVTLGDRLTLPFEYGDDVDNPDVEWTKDNKVVPPSDTHYRISYPNKSTSVLQVEKTTAIDSGIYTAVENKTNSRKTIRVEIMPKGIRPSMKSYPSKVNGKLGEPAEISLVLNSIPFATSVEWSFKSSSKDSKFMRPVILSNSDDSNKYEFRNEPIDQSKGELQDVALKIKCVEAQDAGEYIVKCGNAVGWSSLRIPLVITEEAQNKKSPPRFSVRLQSEFITPPKGTVRLICKVAGNPTPIVQWKKNGNVLQNTNKIQINKISEKHELTLLNCDESDQGLYEAIAQNSLGFDDCSCHVNVTSNMTPDSNLIVPSQHNPLDRALTPIINNDNELVPLNEQHRTQLVFSNTVVRSPPQFVTTFTDAVVQEGSQLTLKCCIIAQPEPVVWWSFNTRFLKDHPRIHMSREHDEYLLVMNELNEGDSGRYSITAENSSGLATCSALVCVEKASIHSRGHSLDRTKYPTKSKPLEGVKFPCHTTLGHTMSPRGTVQNNQIEESRIMQVTSGQHNQLPPPPNYKHGDGESNYGDISDSDVDVESLRTKTVRTYHYSGPSGVVLPGIGYIAPRSPVNDYDDDEDTVNEDDTDDGFVTTAKFVSGTAAPNRNYKSPSPNRYNNPNMSCVESSDCDFL